MKKHYITPKVKPVRIQSTHILCGSAVYTKQSGFGRYGNTYDDEDDEEVEVW